MDCKIDKLVYGPLFSAQLNQIDTAINHRFGHASRIRGINITQVQNTVEPAAAEIGGGQASNYSCNRAGIGLISKSSELMSRSTNPVS